MGEIREKFKLLETELKTTRDKNFSLKTEKITGLLEWLMHRDVLENKIAKLNKELLMLKEQNGKLTTTLAQEKNDRSKLQEQNNQSQAVLAQEKTKAVLCTGNC